MKKDLADALKMQVSLWVYLIDSGGVSDRVFKSAEYRHTLLSLKSRLEEENESEEIEENSNPIDLQFMVSGNAENAKKGMFYLKAWMKGAERITICDPYVFRFEGSALYNSIEEYSAGLANIIPYSAKRVDIYGNGHKTAVRNAVVKEIKNGRNISIYSSHKIHDRFIIKNGNEGKMIGTSFGGFGNKFFCILDLPDQDVQEIISELRSLCPRPLQAHNSV